MSSFVPAKTKPDKIRKSTENRMVFIWVLSKQKWRGSPVEAASPFLKNLVVLLFRYSNKLSSAVLPPRIFVMALGKRTRFTIADGANAIFSDSQADQIIFGSSRAT